MKDKVVVITGGSGGIGKAMAKAFLAEGAKSIVLADLHEDAVKAAAAEIGCIGMVCDVTKEADIISVVEQTLASEGQIDLFCSNATQPHRLEMNEAHTQYGYHAISR